MSKANLGQVPPAAQDPLSQLRPIILPEHGVSWWPPAPGWWILLVLTMSGIGFALWWHKRSKAKAARLRLQQDFLQQLENSYRSSQGDDNVQRYLQDSNRIFKQLVKYCEGAHHEHAAAFTYSGKQWVDFLQQQAPVESKIAHWALYGDTLYSPGYSGEQSLTEIHQQACEWATHFYQTHQLARQQSNQKSPQQTGQKNRRAYS